MIRRRISLLSTLGLAGCAALALAAGGATAKGRDPDAAVDAGSRAQQRLDRDTQRAAQRAEEQASRYAAERIKINERAAQDPVRAAEEIARLNADYTREQQKIAEDAAKAQTDYAEKAAKEAEDAAEDAARLAERGDDSSNHGSSEMIRDLGESEGAEHDADGYPVRRGELVGIDISPATMTAAEARGFRVISRQRLEWLGREVIRIEAPQGMTALEARGVMQQLDAGAVVDFVHYYGLNLTAGGTGGKGRAPSRRATLSGALAAGVLAVGVIDTAIARHAALGSARIVPWAAGNQPAAPTAHGTAVASILAGQGRATIYSANIFRGPAGRPFTSADVIAEALEWTLAQGVLTINMSLAGPRNAILDRLVRDALASGHTVVAAAGNGGPAAPPAYPAAVAGVVAVTAVDKDLRIYRYANRGNYIAVAAKGVDVVAANALGGYARFTGTSFATPQVAGKLARCRSEGGSARTCADQLRRAARDLGTAGFDPVYGYGYIE